MQLQLSFFNVLLTHGIYTMLVVKSRLVTYPDGWLFCFTICIVVVYYHCKKLIYIFAFNYKWFYTSFSVIFAYHTLFVYLLMKIILFGLIEFKVDANMKKNCFSEGSFSRYDKSIRDGKNSLAASYLLKL